MLFVAFEGYNSIRETVLGLLSNAHRLGHLGLDYVVRRSTLSEANARRTPDIFARVYYDTYRRYSGSLADSRLVISFFLFIFWIRLYEVENFPNPITLIEDLILLKSSSVTPSKGMFSIFSLTNNQSFIRF